MSADFYLRAKEGKTLYQQCRVLVGTSNGLRVMTDRDADLVDASGEFETSLYSCEVPQPYSIADVRDILAGGRYELYDEYGERRDIDEVVGEYE